MNLINNHYHSSMKHFKIEVGQVWRNLGKFPKSVFKITRIDLSIQQAFCFENDFKAELGFCHIDSEGYYYPEPGWEIQTALSNGLNCSKCKEHFPMAVSNQENGTLICWSCKNYPFYKGRLS